MFISGKSCFNDAYWRFAQIHGGLNLIRLIPVMPKKDKSELWIAPQYSLKGPNGERAWENRCGGAPSNNRYLELADIALGLKKPDLKKRKPPVATHQTARKTKPYSA